MIERWFRSFKYEEAYLTQYNNIREARQAIRSYVKKYNFERCHSAIGGVPPAQAYFPAMLLDAARATAWNKKRSPLGTCDTSPITLS